MAEFDPNHPPFVVLVFDARPGSPTMGHVSVNGEPFTKFNLKLHRDRPGGGGKKVKASEAPPPADGDDGAECFFCDTHGSCRVHVWTGNLWKCLGSPCVGPFCS